MSTEPSAKTASMSYESLWDASWSQPLHTIQKEEFISIIETNKALQTLALAILNQDKKSSPDDIKQAITKFIGEFKVVEQAVHKIIKPQNALMDTLQALDVAYIVKDHAFSPGLIELCKSWTKESIHSHVNKNEMDVIMKKLELLTAFTKNIEKTVETEIVGKTTDTLAQKQILIQLVKHLTSHFSELMNDAINLMESKRLEEGTLEFLYNTILPVLAQAMPSRFKHVEKEKKYSKEEQKAVDGLTNLHAKCQKIRKLCESYLTTLSLLEELKKA